MIIIYFILKSPDVIILYLNYIIFKLSINKKDILTNKIPLIKYLLYLFVNIMFLFIKGDIFIKFAIK